MRKTPGEFMIEIMTGCCKMLKKKNGALKPELRT